MEIFMKSADKKQDFLNAIKATGKTQMTKSELKEVANSIGMKSLGWFTKQDENKVSYGLYKVPSDDNSNIVAMPVVDKSANTIKDITTSIENSDNVPVVDKNYVAFGNFSDIENIIRTRWGVGINPNTTRASFEAIIVGLSKIL